VASNKRVSSAAMLPIDLSGKVAVVTGATGELGRVITRTLARAGASVAIHYLTNDKRALQLCDEVAALGVKATVVQADVTDAASVFRMQTAVARVLGDASILVNNAVIQYPWTTVLEQKVEDYESQFRSSVLHTVLMAKAFVPAMVRARYGRVIAINTECAMQSAPTQSAYAAGKRGLDGIVRVLAKEVGPHNVTVNQVAPGWMVSERDRASGTERQPTYDEKVPMRRRGEDQDVANAVAFLASDLAAFVTGAYLPVCGGNVMPCI
jgi:3-oxoacyl-[acyl-carrier protein] reductase